MATDKQRIQGYVKPDIYARFINFKESHQLSESEALGTILAQFFGLSSQLMNAEEIALLRAELASHISSLSDRVTQLEKELVADVEPLPKGQEMSKASLAEAFVDLPLQQLREQKDTATISVTPAKTEKN